VGVALAVAVTLAVQTLAAMAMIAPSVLAPVAAGDLGVAPQSIGIFVSITYLCAMFSGLLSGRLLARYGALALCQAAVVLVGIGLALGRFGSVSLLLIAALLIGFGYGFVTPASSHLLARRTPANMLALIFSVKQTGVPLGGAIAGTVVPPLVLAFGWGETLPLLAAACIGAAFVLALSRKHLAEPPGSHGSATLSVRGVFAGLAGPIRLALSHARLREMAFASLGYAAVQLVFITYFVSYLNLALGYSLVAAGLVYAFAHGAGVVGRIVWGAIADRWLPPRTMLAVLGFIATACGVLSAAFSDAWPLAAVVAVAVLYGASAVGWNGVYLAEVARCAPPGQVGAATGGTQFFTFAGAFAGPPLFAACVSLTGSYAWSFALFAIPPLLVGVRLFRPQGREAS
jgi:MFS family permease